jgi:hypothetical protein
MLASVLLPSALFEKVGHLIATGQLAEGQTFVHVCPGGNKIPCKRLRHPESNEDYIELSFALPTN